MSDERRTFRSPIVIGLLGFLAAAALLTAFIDPPAAPRPAPPGSSLSTEPAGVSAAADLLRRLGRDVVTAREPLAVAVDRHPGATHFIIGYHSSESELDAAADRVLAGGGRVVVSGTVPGPTRRLAAAAGDGAVTFPAPGFARVGRVAVPAGALGWVGPQDLLPVVKAAELTLVGLSIRGGGEMVAMSHFGLITNEALHNAGNAELVLALAGNAATVVFHESIHGFSADVGFAALGTRWAGTFAGLLLAGGVWMLGRSRRFGPIEPAADDAPPPRAAYIDAMAGILRAGKRPGSAAALARRAIRRRLRLRAAGTGSEADLVVAAAGLGIEEAEARRALGDGGSEADLVAVARVLRRLHH